MRRTGILGALVASLLVLSASLGVAFEPPGLTADANRYAAEIRRLAPAGGNPQQRADADRRLREAASRNDLAAQIAAQEARIALGAANDPDAWLALSDLQARKVPPELGRALAAAWQAYQVAPGGAGEIPALLKLADLLERMDRIAQAIPMIEQVIARAPENGQYRARLAALRRAAGVAVARVTTDPEADPARACVNFVSPLPAAARGLADYVAITPPAQVALEVSDGALCIAGLPHGQTSRITLQRGLPGADGATLARDTVLEVAMPDRAATVALDSGAFILPRGQGAAVSVSTVNLSAVGLRLVRISERGLAQQIVQGRLRQPVSPWVADRIAGGEGSLVWQGSMTIPRWEKNRAARTRLDLAPMVAGQGPGVFVLLMRPDDGTPFDPWDAQASQWIVLTDMALTSLRGRDGLTVLARAIDTARPLAGVKLSLVARSNEILAQAGTDADGVARFAAPLLAGRGGNAPLSIAASADNGDFAFLDLSAANFDLSDRGAEGRPHPGPLDAWVWTERGIFRPGESVNLSVLLRSEAGDAADFAARVRVRRPNGTLFYDAAPAREAGGRIALALQLPAGAPQGGWSIEVFSDPDAEPIARGGFRVEDFVPERVAVSIADPGRPLVPGTPLPIGISARWLYGPPAAGFAGPAEVVVEPDPDPFPALRGWRFGVVEESAAPLRFEIPVPPTDAQGNARIMLDLPQAPDTVSPLRASIAVALSEPGSRPARATLAVPVRRPGPILGLRPLFTGGAVNEGAEAAFEVAAFDAAGNRIAAPDLRARVVRERPDFRLVIRERTARYETVWRDEPESDRPISLGTGEPARIAFSAGFGRWRVEVFDPAGLAAVSYRFRAGWSPGGGADVPDRLDIAADRQVYRAGDVARLAITPPFAGVATVVVATDRVWSLRVVDVPAGGTTVEIPVDAAWGPGAYVAALLHRPRGGLAAAAPLRAIGLAWLGLDPAARRLEVAIEAPGPVRPRTQVVIPVRVSGAGTGTEVALAAVDEGILRLTRHASPDPAGWFAGRRRLGLDVRDDYGRVIAPAEGPAGLLRSGGDELGGAALPVVPIRIVSIMLPAQAVGADGIARFTLGLPDFDGEIRLMAFAWNGAATGGGAAPLTVQDRLVVEPTLPRFLAPGDEARLSVALQNIDLPAGPISLSATVEGPLQILGELPYRATLAPGQRTRATPTLRATASGIGAITFPVTGPENFAAAPRYDIAVRPPRGLVTELVSQQLAPGATLAIPPTLLASLMPGAVLTASAGSVARFDAAALMRALDAWAYGCTEQAISRGLPLTIAADESLVGEHRRERLGQSVATVLGRQRYDGAFGLWSAHGPAEPWITAYAAEFLLRARAAGISVPEAPLDATLRWLTEQVAELPGRDASAEWAAHAYAQYVLALAGRPRPGALRLIADANEAALPTPLARAQLAAALARTGDRIRAERLFGAALAQPARQPWWDDFGSAMRDAAAMVVLLEDADMLRARIPALLDRLPVNEAIPRYLSTQEMAWAVAAAAAVGRDGRPVSLSLDGQAIAPAPRIVRALGANAALRNTGAEPVWITLSAAGIPRNPLAAGREGMRVARRFFNRDGTPTSLDQVRANEVFFVQLEGRAETGQAHRALVAHLLPAGWEIEPVRLGTGTPEAYPFLGELSEPVGAEARDDRFAAAFDLTAENALFRTAFMVRAVSAGSFALPGAELFDMYRPRFFARQAEGRITILPRD
ncbi:MAG: alpha-2-macroglobulin family protein [Acetobacteraceae bacterium]|nr:alpha-2-macroglobulin family protein [Acetobacteraceae bacterium]